MEYRREDVSAAFGQVLRKRRKKAGLTQAALAEASGLHDTYISFLERGQRQPSVEVALRLAGALGVSGSRLVEQVEEQLDERE